MKTPQLKGSPAEALQYALKLLNYRSRSEREMSQRLKKRGFQNNTIQETLGYLKNAGLIRDHSLATELFRITREKKYLGRKGIENFMQKRGITNDIIAQTVSTLTEDMEKDTALKLVDKKLKFMHNYPQHTKKRKLWGMLKRRGFSFDIIRSAVKSIDDNNLH
jgi:regulatory protein